MSREEELLPVSDAAEPGSGFATRPEAEPGSKSGPRVFFVHLESLSSNLDQTAYLAAALFEDGWDPHIVCPVSNPLADVATTLSLPLHTLPDNTTPGFMAAWKLARIVTREWRRDLKKNKDNQTAAKHKGLVHACDPLASQLVSRAWRLDKKLRIAHTRRVPIMEPSAKAVRCYQEPPAKVITDSLAGKIALRLSGVETHNLHTIACGIDPAVYRPRRDRKDGRIIFGVTGELTPSRGHGLLFDALALLAEINGLPPWEVRVLGEGPHFPALLEEARMRNVADHLAFLGGADTTEQLAQCDILVLPASEGESHVPLVLQGWAVRIPIVAINRLDHAEILQDENNALLVQPGDAAQLAGQMAHLANDRALRAHLAKGGAASLAKFPLELMVLEHKRLYGQILA